MIRLFSVLLLSIVFSTSALAVDTPRTPAVKQIGKETIVFVWTGLDGDDTGVPVETGQCRRMTAHVYSATYGSSTVTVEGSNDPLYATSAEWVGLTDPQGTAISKTSDAVEAIEEQVWYFRPKTASGTAAAVAVALVCQK